MDALQQTLYYFILTKIIFFFYDTSEQPVTTLSVSQEIIYVQNQLQFTAHYIYNHCGFNCVLITGFVFITNNKSEYHIKRYSIIMERFHHVTITQ